MLLLGCRPPGRFTEQHDVFFGIAREVKDLVPAIKKSWPEVKGNIHVDAWREVNCVDTYSIQVAVRGDDVYEKNSGRLFFINLGGYKEKEFDEFHYKLLVVANNLEEAKSKAKKTAFFKHSTPAPGTKHFKASSHIDDKYGIDTDDAFAVEEILAPGIKEQYRIVVQPNGKCLREDDYHLGFFKLTDL